MGAHQQEKEALEKASLWARNPVMMKTDKTPQEEEAQVTSEKKQPGSWDYEVGKDKGEPSETGLAHSTDNSGCLGKVRLRTDDSFNFCFLQIGATSFRVVYKC